MITLEKEINISRLYEEKGDLYYRLGEYNEAIKDYKEAIKFGDKALEKVELAIAV